MDSRGAVLTPTQLRDELLELRTRLTHAISAVAHWRQYGLHDGKVPISVLPIEAKLRHSLQEVESCLTFLRYLETQSILRMSD